jgi:hypothetical protein
VDDRPDGPTILGLLADDDRRRVVAALVLGAATTGEVRSATGLGTRAAATALSRLVDAELVVRGADDTYVLLGAAFQRAAIAAASPRPTTDVADDVPEDQARVLRTFLREGRIVSIPTQHSKRLVLLDHLAQRFEPGRRYAEREVNTALRPFHTDVATLRRYLVDEGFLDRESGEYWRSGGTYPLDEGSAIRP